MSLVVRHSWGLDPPRERGMRAVQAVKMEAEVSQERLMLIISTIALEREHLGHCLGTQQRGR